MVLMMDNYIYNVMIWLMLVNYSECLFDVVGRHNSKILLNL